MRVVVTPQQTAIIPGQPQPITITITNTSTVIGGYAVRVLGADPGWVSFETEQVSLFPEESRTLSAVITAPRGIPAGPRRVAIQVRELTPPEASSITEIDLTVPEAKGVSMRADPIAITAGKRAAFSLIIANIGNTMIRSRPSGDDPETKVSFTFDPPRVDLAPGEHAIVDVKARARRHFSGSPTVRQLSLYLDDVPDDAFFNAPPEPESETPPVRADNEALANATFIQKSVLTRGALSLVGLLAAVTVFAIVIVYALSKLVGQSTADRDLALAVAAARNSTAGSGTSGIAGTVKLLSSGDAVSGVQVTVYNASDTSTPLATTATDTKGVYNVSDLAAGKYKISFQGAGFVEIWYPGAATDADATTVTLAPNQKQNGVDVSLGGVPATISGTVVGDDVSAATLYLEAIPGGNPATTSPASGSSVNLSPTVTATGPGSNAAILQTIPIGSDGTFMLTNVPSPSVYELVVSKIGYATSTQQINIGAGENRTGVQVTLTKGNGQISGTIRSATAALPGATITATSGQSVTSTVSLTSTGAFTLRQLPTPATFTVTASAPGYATQTLTLSLTSGQTRTGVAITLGTSAGTMSGTVDLASTGKGTGDVTVSVANGQATAQTVTQSSTQGGQAVGSWSISGLPVPGTYTVTFSRFDLASQTLSVSLSSAGAPPTVGANPGASVSESGDITVDMVSSTATVSGTISQVGANTSCPTATDVGEATVTLNSGSASYVVTSASVPAAECGQYFIGNLPPGTYTLTVSAGSGTSPSSQVIVLAAGQNQVIPVQLQAAASMTGTVCMGPLTSSGTCDPTKVRPGWSVFLYAAAQYPNVVLAQTVTAGTPTKAGDPAEGTFTFNDIPAGNYIVAVGPTDDPANATNTQQVTVLPSKQQVVVIKVDQ